MINISRIVDHFLLILKAEPLSEYALKIRIRTHIVDLVDIPSNHTLVVREKIMDQKVEEIYQAIQTKRKASKEPH